MRNLNSYNFFFSKFFKSFTKTARTLSTLILITFCATSTITSQESLKSLEENYFDYLSLIGIMERPTLGYRTLSDNEWSYLTDEDGNDLSSSKLNLWNGINFGSTYNFFTSESKGNFFTKGLERKISLKIYGPDWYNSYNTYLPYGQNDGALWQGRGYNTSLTSGLRLEAFGLELTFKPQISFSQNLEFDYLTGVYGSDYSYYSGSSGGSIDLVQRYGDEPFFTYDWGDTELRYTWYTFTIGIGYQSPWLGPAWLNPMLGSNNAGTYPKVDIGFRKTSVTIPWCNWYIGDFETRMWTGYLTSSQYFNTSYTYDTMLNALNASFAPSFVPGLTVGVNRIFLTRWKTENLKYIGRLFTLSHSNDVDGDGEDQKCSLYFDYLFPKVGFEAYGEYGFDDFSSNEICNPFHTGIYTAGIKQNIPLPSDKLTSELIVEMSNFEASQDFQLQWAYSGFYSHSKILTGYTQNGQLLGAGSGYFGNSQYVAYRLNYPKGETTLFVHRSCPDNNYIYKMAVYSNASSGSTTSSTYYGCYQTYVTFGLQSTYFITPSLSVSGEFDWIYAACYKYEASNNFNTYRYTVSFKYDI